MQIRPRKASSLLKLSKAAARTRLSNDVQIQDIETAEFLLKASIQYGNLDDNGRFIYTNFTKFQQHFAPADNIKFENIQSTHQIGNFLVKIINACPFKQIKVERLWHKISKHRISLESFLEALDILVSVRRVVLRGDLLSLPQSSLNKDSTQSKPKKRPMYEGAEELTDWLIKPKKGPDRKSTRLNSSHSQQSRMPSSA